MCRSFLNMKINKKLQKKILTMAICEQRARKLAMKDSQNKKLIKKVYNCDTKNITEAKKIIKKYGWPTFNLIGKKAVNSFWIIVQHADRDTKFQKQCLELLKKTTINKQAKPKSLAFLTDRVLSAEGKAQKFGTQFVFKNGKLVPGKIFDKKNVNKRRSEYGLNTLEERTAEINKEFVKLKK